MFNATRKTLATVGALAAVGAGGAAIAGAAGNSGTSQREDETALTGDTAEKVRDAALARVEGGTIIRVETDADHGSPYEAHVRRADGTEVEVLVDASFKVTAVNEMPARGPGGPGGPGGRGHRIGGPAIGALAERLGVTRAQLRAAFRAVGEDGRPGKGSLAADLASALGVERSAVEKILEANRPSGPRERPAPGTAPDHGDLVAALASGLNIDMAKVQAAIDKLEAAHRADHDDHHAELAAALAKQLGLKADDVAAALEATRPDPPRRP